MGYTNLKQHELLAIKKELGNMKIISCRIGSLLAVDVLRKPGLSGDQLLQRLCFVDLNDGIEKCEEFINSLKP